MEGGQGGKHGLDELSPSHSRDEPTLPRHQLPSSLVHEVLEIDLPQTMDRKRQPKISQREGNASSREALKDGLNLDVTIV